MTSTLPPGPRSPRAFQSLGWWHRPIAYLERCRARYGGRFTIRFVQTPPFVMISEPVEIKQVFTAPPDVLHPGEGARILEPVVGSNSVILLDEAPHLEQRRLLLPAFHGDAMAQLTDLMRETAEREIARWPTGEAIELHPRLQGLTLEIILRAVFGLDPGERLDALRERLTKILEFGNKPASVVPALQRGPAFRAFRTAMEETDALLLDLVDERRRDGAERHDTLALLLAARHEDGSPMSHQEIRDELMTMLVAGHETTASQLAWTFGALARDPRVLRTLREEIDRDGDDAYLTATVQEAMRRRPVLMNAEPRLVVKPIDVGDWHYEPGPVLAACAYLVHHDPAIYDAPYAFRPERFLEEPPGTYTWIPFGGGRRRCIGASFATLEMKLVLREVVARHELAPATGAPERARRRSITISPRAGARTVLRPRERVPLAQAA